MRRNLIKRPLMVRKNFGAKAGQGGPRRAKAGQGGPSVDRLEAKGEAGQAWAASNLRGVGAARRLPRPRRTAPRKQRHAPTPCVAAWIVARRRLSLPPDRVNRNAHDICRINNVHEAQVEFAGAPSSVSDARQFAHEVLEAANVNDDDWTAIQVVSELATNAVVHARTDFILRIEYDDTYIKVSVVDAKPLARATVRRFSDITTTGRGLRLVQLLGELWGVEQTPTAKTVWCKLRRGAAASDDIVVAFDAMGLRFEGDDANETDDAQVTCRVTDSCHLVAA